MIITPTCFCCTSAFVPVFSHPILMDMYATTCVATIW